MKEWHCALDGKIHGPFPEEALRGMARRGELTPDTLVWNGEPENAAKGWTRAADTEVGQLFREGETPQEPHNQTETPPPPPMASPGEGGVPGAVELATRWQRFLAVFLDFLLAGAIWAVATIIAAVVFGLYIIDPYAIKTGDVAALLFVSALFVLPTIFYSIYNIYLLHKNSQTLGKKIMNIKIANPDGSRTPTWKILILRGFVPSLIGCIPIVGQLFFIADICCLFRDDRRTLHDMLAGTIVIRD
ncbi:MAG: RDD family protein [Synergistaceae bacterium]|jgi:uncharacterized RDD family membrane protein YckC|nr:RDD family protein [Synergistaceae bacterium]